MELVYHQRKVMFQKSYAKINLFLDILFLRDDGFREIRTVFSEIDLYDELNFVLTKKSDIQILTEIDELRTKQNLIYQIAIFIQSRYNVTKGCSVTLKKNIPISAGLGGGSSNAATTILALSELWNLSLSMDEMNEIASKFGSDINFFILGGSAIGTGRGEKIEEIDNIDVENIVLINPGIYISSREAYQLVGNETRNPDRFQQFLSKKDIRYSFNRLEFKIRENYKKIDDIFYQVQNIGAKKAILSGSGSTVIAFCPNSSIANEISNYYSKKKYWNCITKTKRRTL